MRSINKGAIITGSSSGIGKEAAKRLVAKGASVVLSGRDEAKLQAAAKEIGGSFKSDSRCRGRHCQTGDGSRLGGNR
jgi:short-subunit dehydrogenase